MRTILFALLALIGGLIAGVVVTEIISIVSLILFDGTRWLMYLRFFPVGTAVLGVSLYLIWRRQSR